MKDCNECQNEGFCIPVLITQMLKWRNSFGTIWFDEKTKEILVNEERLMQMICMVNPGQPNRKIRLISEDEYEKYKKEDKERQKKEVQEYKEIQEKVRQYEAALKKESKEEN